MDIRFDNVSFGYGDRNVLNNISFELNGPGLYCIIGPNGVGKSTLVKCMNKLLEPREGKVYLNGQDLSETTLKEVSQIVGYVPASTQDCFSMPVVDAVLIGRHNKRKWKTGPEDLEIVQRTLRMLDLEEFSMRHYNELSAGQHQKVTLARGLVQETDILILDEPTANLDVKHQVYVTQLLSAIANRHDKMIIMICHDLNIAARYADEIVVLAPPGKLDCVGTPDEAITEERIRRIYGIDCSVIQFEDAPHIILKSMFSEDL